MNSPNPAPATVTPIVRRSVCDHCDHPVSPRAAMCPQCGHPFSAGLRVVLRGLDLSFFDLVGFFVVAALAAIPAALMVGAVVVIVMGVLSGLMVLR